MATSVNTEGYFVEVIAVIQSVPHANLYSVAIGVSALRVGQLSIALIVLILAGPTLIWSALITEQWRVYSAGGGTVTEMLIVARVLQGFAAAMMAPQTLAIAQVIFPPRERGAR